MPNGRELAIVPSYLKFRGAKDPYHALINATLNPVPVRLTGVTKERNSSPPKLPAGIASKTLGGIVNVPAAAGTEHKKSAPTLYVLSVALNPSS